MTDTITPEEYEIAAKVADAEGDYELRDILRARAAHRRAESARDEYMETLAKAIAEGTAGHFTPVGGSWDDCGDYARDAFRAAARTALDRLAADGRLLPEGGMVDVSKQVDGDLTEAELAQVAADLETIGTPPAVSAPLELPTEPGSRIRASVKRWGSALEWADTDPYVDTFTLGERDIWHAENDCLVVGAWNREYITVLEVLPAASVPDGGPDGTPEKPWPTWQQVPEGVEYKDIEGDRYVNREGVRWKVFGPGRSTRNCALNGDWLNEHCAPFVRVDGDQG